MSNKPNKKRIGLFLMIGFICLFGIISHFIIEKIMPNNTNMVVMFFNESIKGLSIGSPVVLEGVEVGKVSRISLYTDPKTLEFRIPVYIRFNQDSQTGAMLKSVFGFNKSRDEIIADLVERGLRGRLVSRNFLTGQLMIELIMQPESPVKLVEIPETKHVLQIPTVLSTIGELSKGFQDLPLKAIVNKFNNILNSFETEMPKILPQFKFLGENLNNTIPEFKKLGENLNNTVPVFVQLGENLNKTVIHVDKQIPKTSQTINHVNMTLDDISKAAKSLRNLADYLEQHPESILKGKAN